MSESCETRESPQSDTNQHEHVKYDSKARIWFFEGSLVLDLDLDEWTEEEIRILSRDDLVPSVVAHFGTDYFKKPPVPITYMEIGIDFSKASLGGIVGRTFTAEWTPTSTIGLCRNLELMAAVRWQHRIYTFHRS